MDSSPKMRLRSSAKSTNLSQLKYENLTSKKNITIKETTHIDQTTRVGEKNSSDNETDDFLSKEDDIHTSYNQDNISTDATDEIPDKIVDKWLISFDGLQSNSYWLTRIVLLRAVAFIFFVAFLVAYHQNKQLIGDRGLLPLRLYLAQIEERTSDGGWWARITAAPTLLWLASPWPNVDIWLDVIALTGLTLSALVLVTGTANWVVMMVMWVLYHSLVAVGQSFYSFGWESQLLETSLLISWGVSFTSLEQLPWAPPSYVTVYGLRWLMFRIMLGAGLIKIRGDRCWKEFTCMDYHYETQPVPNPASWLLHHSPPLVHQLEVVGNHVVELVVPWMIVGWHRGCMAACGVVQIAFQIILIISGNLSFLNWLTIVPSLALFDDRFYSKFFSANTTKEVAKRQILSVKDDAKVQPGLTRDSINLLLSLLLILLSVPVAVNLLSSRQHMNTSYDPFRILNTYGAFGSITKARDEVVLEGLARNDTWLEYGFKCKPGDVARMPCVISPYHYRLDWLMWFAAMQPAQSNPWLFHLCHKLLSNDPVADQLMAHNPFEGVDPPRSVRAKLYRYQYTVPFTGTKDWYTRTLQRVYIPPMSNETMRLMVQEMDW